MLTISSSSITQTIHRPILRRRYSQSSDLYRPRTIIIEKPTTSISYGFSIQTYGFASLNPLSTDESACSFLSLSSGSTTSRKSSTTNSFCSSSHIPPIQLVTYVDHVQDKSPAWEAGLRSGSVILSVNDQSVEHDDHETLVKRITQASITQLKLVIIQQNVNKQIALCEQLQQLHKQLHEKEEELKELSKQEMNNKNDLSIKGKRRNS
jgi:C-terminal processing protease CtpA/Prc